MDNPHEHRTAHSTPAMQRWSELRAIMEQSDRDLASGQTVPLADVLVELDDVAKEIEARRGARPRQSRRQATARVSLPSETLARHEMGEETRNVG